MKPERPTVGHSRPVGDAVALAPATGSLPVSSANVLGITKAWEKRAIAHEEKSREQSIFGGDAMRQMHWEIANTYRTCVMELRRQVEREIQRQPEENDQDQTRADERTKDMKALTTENAQKLIDTIRDLHTPDSALRVAGTPEEQPREARCSVASGSGFVDTTETLGWLDDDDGENFNEWCSRWWQKGFRRWPDHVPAPLDGYDFVSWGPMLYAHPPCSRWHRFLFRLPAWLAWKLYRPNTKPSECAGQDSRTPDGQVPRIR